MVVEPAGLAVLREYEIPWRKQSLDIAELARLRFEEGLGSRQIARRLGIPRTTAITAVHRMERARGLKMTSFIKWMVGIAIGVAISGHLKSATLKMAQMAVEAQQHQLSYGKFSRMLTTPITQQHKRRGAGD